MVTGLEFLPDHLVDLFQRPAVSWKPMSQCALLQDFLEALFLFLTKFRINTSCLFAFESF